MSAKFKEIADKVWRLRDIARKQAKEKEDKLNRGVITEEVTMYIQEHGLPSGYNSVEELVQELERIEKVPCCEIIEKEVTS